VRRWLAAMGLILLCCCNTYGGGTCCANVSFCSGFVPGCVCVLERCGMMEAP